MDIFTDIIKPYGVAVVIVCIATYGILKLAEFICKKKNYTMHPWFKVLAPFIVSAVYVFITKGFFDVKVFAGNVFNLASYAAMSYMAIIKWLTAWLESMAEKMNTSTPTDAQGK